jgi:hypothetical protein
VLELRVDVEDWVTVRSVGKRMRAVAVRRSGICGIIFEELVVVREVCVGGEVGGSRLIGIANFWFDWWP